MSCRKGGQKRGVSPTTLPPPRWRRPSVSSSQHASPSGASGHCPALPTVSAVLSGVPVPPFVPAPGPVHLGGSATFVVLPEIMAAIERKPLLVPDLPSSLNQVGAVLLHWAIVADEGRFRIAKAVVRTPLLQEHLPMGAEE